MSFLSNLKSINIEKLVYLFIAASPGGLKIFTLAIVGFFATGQIQGEVANDLSITAFLLMLTAIGAGTQILHLIPKDSDSSEKSAEIFKSLLAKLIPYILSISTTLYLLNKFLLKTLNTPLEASLLLFTSSIYWIFRHYYLARSDLNNLIALEAITWIGTALTTITLSAFGKLTPSYILFYLSVTYLISVTAPLASLIKYRNNRETKIIADATSIGLSNLASGGIINLAPSICFHVSGPALAGAVGLITNICSIALTIIRAYLLKKIPEISNTISLKLKEEFDLTFNKTCTTTTKITLISFIAIQPIAIGATYATQPELGLSAIILYSSLIAAFICTPQLCATESVIINFFEKSKTMLLINLAHAISTIVITLALYAYLGKSPEIFITFLATSIALYILRNYITRNIVIREILARKTS